MTNKEKAQELSEEAIDYVPCNSTLPFYLNALKMAEWKDKQFKELLYKWLNDDGKIDITKGSIDELLKEIDNEF